MKSLNSNFRFEDYLDKPVWYVAVKYFQSIKIDILFYIIWLLTVMYYCLKDKDGYIYDDNSWIYPENRPKFILLGFILPVVVYLVYTMYCNSKKNK